MCATTLSTHQTARAIFVHFYEKYKYIIINMSVAHVSLWIIFHATLWTVCAQCIPRMPLSPTLHNDLHGLIWEAVWNMGL